MRKIVHSFCLLSALTCVVTTTGCGAPATKEQGSETKADEHASEHGDSHSGHDHAAEHKGPHGGQVIEVGRDHQYHAEIVEDEPARSITVYLLDNNLEGLAIDQPSITMNLTVDGVAKSFDLAAAGKGNSSQFNAADASLFEALHEHGATGKLRVTIDGTPYSGEVTHHDHDEHAHGEHEHEH